MRKFVFITLLAAKVRLCFFKNATQQQLSTKYTAKVNFVSALFQWKQTKFYNIFLTYFFPMFPFIPTGKLRKSLQGLWKGYVGKKSVNMDIKRKIENFSYGFLLIWLFREISVVILTNERSFSRSSDSFIWFFVWLVCFSRKQSSKTLYKKLYIINVI